MKLPLIQKWIDFFRGKSLSHGFYEHEISQKFWMLKQNMSSIDTLILGSSHGAYGIDTPQFSPNSFNLCSTSQDLYYSFHLMNKLKKSLKLKRIILVYSVFSSGLEVQKTIDYEVCNYFKCLYDIDYKLPDDQNLGGLYKVYKSLSKKRFPLVKDRVNTQGYVRLNRYFDQNAPVKERVKTHLRENERKNDVLSYLIRFIDMAQQEGMDVFILIPPARRDYLDCLPHESELFASLYSMIEGQDITLCNYFSDSQFEWEDFGDFDHLTEAGASKLTSDLKRLVL
ncbi:MAG: hypothetical protein HEQ32_02035 [Vampirovibrio sp.]